MKTTPRTTALLLGLALLAGAVCSRAQSTTDPGTKPGPAVQPPAHSLEPTVVTLTVTEFNEVCAPAAPNRSCFTQATMGLGMDKSGRVRLEGEVLHVTAPGATLKFVVSPKGGAEVFYPVGIAFVRRHPPAEKVEDPLGLQVFHRLPSADPEAMLIDDRFAPTPRRMAVQYEFWLVIQRGSDGKLGIIDPGIINES